MQSDLAKSGIVTYGFDRLSTYGQVERQHPARTRFVRSAHHRSPHADIRAYTLEFSVLGTAAAFFVCGLCSEGAEIHTAAAPVRNFVFFDLEAPCSSTVPQERTPLGEEQIRNAILEMRSAHTSLPDKALGETSESEREYPW